MSTFTKRAALSLTACAALTIPALAAPTKTAPTSKLTGVKTVQVTETVSVGDSKGTMLPQEVMTVKILSPSKVWITSTSLTKPADGKIAKPAVFVINGKTQYEYSGRSNKYVKSAAPAPGHDPDVHLVGLYSEANVPLLLGKTVTERHTTKIASKDMLNGKPMRLTTTSYPPEHTEDGKTMTFADKIWTDAKTGLPVRRSMFVTTAGKTLEEERIDFSGWVLNKSIAPAQFAWVPPADATVYVEPKLLAKGAIAPDFAAITPDGKTVHLSDYKGKPVILDFWATWCGPCQLSMPHLEKVYQQIKDKDVAVLGVCVWDQKDAYDKWVKEKQDTYHFQTAFDPAGRGDDSIAGKLYGVSGIPTQYIIDKDGKVMEANVGYDNNDHRLETALNKLGFAVSTDKTASAK